MFEKTLRSQLSMYTSDEPIDGKSDNPPTSSTIPLPTLPPQLPNTQAGESEPSRTKHPFDQSESIPRKLSRCIKSDFPKFDFLPLLVSCRATNFEKKYRTRDTPGVTSKKGIHDLSRMPHPPASITYNNPSRVVYFF